MLPIHRYPMVSNKASSPVSSAAYVSGLLAGGSRTIPAIRYVEVAGRHHLSLIPHAVQRV